MVTEPVDWWYGPNAFPAITSAITIAGVVFLNDPTLNPNAKKDKQKEKRQPTVDTITLTGNGKWNGKSGYTFEMRGTDQGEPDRHRDQFSIVIKDSNGVVVASVADAIDGGNIQSMRLPRK